ncbi:AzlD domain-containing protein [Aliihoeflea aestuarii]|jgi:branched-subunit amino acid transport protein|uniref:AzlD domain-containing protein n=1 Tax=Aliihoeflea aestuarii TaxID=453840 RepID=UPI002091F032|nr:AzlD domain-containing protein [Aliihoeflea aestuarii]MCO6390370.1 AzlD domain-containing protein [Aliihoeflea aestuarii]
MTFSSIDTWWWPYLFILIAGWLATDSWRFLGVYLGGRLSEKSDLLVLVRCVATALVAAVIANLIVFPAGPLAETTIRLRVFSAAIGFAAFLWFGKNVLVGIVVTEVVLLSGMVLATYS